MKQIEVRVVREFTFEAAHFLPGYDGPCAHMHGHSYRLQIGVTGPTDASGMVMDFKHLNEIVKNAVVNPLDHTILNESKLEGFPVLMPTAELMVIWIREKLTRLLFSSLLDVFNSPIRISLVRLWETQNSFAEWTAE